MPAAIITGASKGIGSAIAQLFVSKGFDVGLCARNSEGLIQLQKSLANINPNVKVLVAALNVNDEHAVKKFANDCYDQLGNIDILVNNAGVFIPGKILELQTENLQETINVNLMSAFWMTQIIAPKMIAQNKGHIFNMCSVASLQAYPNGGAYSISKYALLGFSDNLRFELKDYNVKVTAVCPGAVYTDSWKGSGVDPERIMDASDIAESIWSAYQLSPKAVVEKLIIRPQLGDL